MATLNFQWKLVKAFDQCKQELEELCFREDDVNNVILVEEKFSMLKWKRTMFIDICNEELSKDDIPEDEITKFQEIYLENLLEMNGFLRMIEEWIQHSSFINQNLKCPNSSQRCYARLKLCEIKAEYKSERIFIKKTLELVIYDDRKIKEKIKELELEFQQRGQELEMIERKLRNNVATLLSRDLKEIKQKKPIEKNLDLVKTPASFGWVVASAVTCKVDKIREKVFLSKEDIKLTKGNIDCLYKMNFAGYYDIETTFLIQSRIHRPALCTFKLTSYVSVCASENKLKSNEEVHEISLQNFHVDNNHLSTANRKEEEGTLVQKVRTVDLKEDVNFYIIVIISNKILNVDKNMYINLHRNGLMDTDLDLLHKRIMPSNGFVSKESFYRIISDMNGLVKKNLPSSENISKITLENSDTLEMDSPSSFKRLNRKSNWSIILYYEFQLPWVLWLEKFCRLENYKYRRRYYKFIYKFRVKL